ncbi:pyridoxal 5'-phosphate synthase glutaminase subunit PdxT [Ruminiclostridium cellobioparum]|uniref:Pyridoxal 5'-phosphate synthase subunit PdxT n=1 Tax=Ruminiclostridium cellobioparum subsp. termitidis CT1112 TaxID=1195236 RepID=S0FLU4_RUMCE|nr:pyridoxal 5'-phosphate synthase glutaminase subunit PdxT [Ruminiclostridium cellobioparum]EMS73205.1 pyridoxal 5''-phosphate synthase, glutaminase subunit Pdx2 [Ruminiclostridium cellobioparum subsp. termitidis CT1112]
MKKIGVLGLQGAVQEHLDMLGRVENVEPVLVKYKSDIEYIDGLIIPGGESTAIGRLLADFELTGPLKVRIESRMPVWGTCAGMIILAKNIANDERRYLEAMDIEVMRNAYGRQLDSFTTSVDLPGLSAGKIPLVFIRAPYVVSVAPQVEILLKLDEHIVACRQGHMLATSFHPELTADLSFHRYFAGMIK